MKKLIIVIAIVAISAACNLKTEKKAENTEAKTTKVEFADFIKDPSPFVGKKVEISGIVAHVCKHGGQKLFLVYGENEERIKVVTGENMAAFSTDLEGSTLKVIGVVEELRIDETYLQEWEKEITEGHSHAKGEEEENTDEHAHGEKGQAADQGEHLGDQQSITNYRKQLAESGKDHLSFYSVVCEKYEIKTEEK